MPTNRKRIARGRVVYTLRLADLTIPELICLRNGWRPGDSKATRWQTWDEFFRDSDAVRAELLADPQMRRIFAGVEPFADRLRRELAAMPGGVYDSHNHPPPYRYRAIWHAHVFYPGD